jgi:hypothetical protein
MSPIWRATGFQVHQAGRDGVSVSGRPGGLRLAFRLAGQSDGLFGAADSDPEGGVAWGRTRRWGWPSTKGRDSCWHPPPRFTATRWCIRNGRITGGTSTRLGRAVATTNPRGLPRRWRWPIIASTRRGHPDRAHFQHLWAADAVARRTGRAGIYQPGVAEPAPDRFWQGPTDAQFLLLRRFDRGDIPFDDEPGQRAGEYRQPGEMTVLEFARAIIRLTGSRSKIVFKPLPQDDPRQRRPDIGRAKELLGWAPRVPLAEGIVKTIEYFQGRMKMGAVVAAISRIKREFAAEKQAVQPPRQNNFVSQAEPGGSGRWRLARRQLGSSF